MISIRASNTPTFAASAASSRDDHIASTCLVQRQADLSVTGEVHTAAYRAIMIILVICGKIRYNRPQRENAALSVFRSALL